MGSIPKFMASVVTIFVGVVVCVSFIICSIVVNSARTYHSSVIDHIEASNFEDVTIEKCILAAEEDNYKLTVEKITSDESEDYKFYKVTLQYGLYAPIFGKVHTGTLVGYALPGAHVEAGTAASSDPVPGLYETGSNYSVLIKDWDTLVSEGVVSVTDGAAGTGFVSGDNASAPALAGDLMLPYDGSVTGVADLGFFKCDLLTGVKVPDAVTTVGRQAFAGCFVLNTVDLGNGITSIDYSAFDYCGGINKVAYSGTLEGWCSIAFDSWQSNPAYYGADLYINGELIVNLIVPSTVTSIENAFIGCGSLESVTIPAGSALEGLNDHAFGRCYNLNTVFVGEGVKTIGEYAFLECDLQVLVVPASVTKIESYALYYCDSLTDIIYRGTKSGWTSITFGSDWNNNTGGYIVHCTDGALPKS